MTEWSKMVWIAVDLLVASILLTWAILIGSSAQIVGQNQQKELDAIAVAKEYREVFRYDEKDLNAQDVISAVLVFKGAPEVWIDTTVGTGKTYTIKYTKSRPYEDFTATKVEEELGDYRLVKYKSHIIKDLNDTVIRIEMEAV